MPNANLTQPPDPAAVADAVCAASDFDTWDEWVEALLARMRANAVIIKGHGVFKELFIGETHDKIIRFQDNDRHLIINNMKYIQGGLHG